MGATLPVYTVLVGARDPASTGRLYAWNTLGGEPPGGGLPDVPGAVRRGLLRGQTSLLAGDRPGELRAYLDTLSIAPRVRIVRSVLVAIANERLAAGDTATAVVVADALRAHAPDAAETAALAGRIARH